MSEHQYVKLSNCWPKTKVSGLILGALSLQACTMLQTAIICMGLTPPLPAPALLSALRCLPLVHSIGFVPYIFPELFTQELLLSSPLRSCTWHGSFCSPESSRTFNHSPLLGRLPLLGPADKTGHCIFLFNPFIFQSITPQSCMM